MDNFINSTLLLGIITYLGYQLRTVPDWIFQQVKKYFVYSTSIEEGTDLYRFFEIWLSKFHMSKLRNTRSDVDDGALKLGHYIDTFLISYGGKRLLINKDREKFDNANDIRSFFYNHFKIQGWRAKDAINALLEEVIAYNKSLNQKPIIFVSQRWGDWQRFGEVYGKQISNVIIPGKDKIVDDITDFVSKEQWYITRGIPYKRGLLLFGPPGNGKTSLCFALAQHFKRDVQFLNLNDFESDTHLFTAFSQLRNNSILVMEDIDTIKNDKISDSGLLNCLDGAFSKHGLILIMTTNHIEKINPILIRDGRIDVKMQVDNPDRETVSQYLSLFYGSPVALNNYSGGLSMSKIQGVCIENKLSPTTTIKILESL